MAVLAQISFIPEIMYANLSARSQRQGLLGSIAMAEPEDHGPGPLSQGPRLGPRAFSVGGVVSFGVSLVWVAQPRKQTLLRLRTLLNA